MSVNGPSPQRQQGPTIFRCCCGWIAARYDGAIAAMKAAGDMVEVARLVRLKADDIRLLGQITQHWLRHKFATDVGRRDLQAAKRQGGWRNTRSILGYLIDDAEYQREIVEDRAGIPTRNDGAIRGKTKREG